MHRFCECKYSFKLTYLWKKLEFYTRVHKKMYLLLFFKSKSGTVIYDNIMIILALRAQGRTILYNFITKQFFFLNSNPEHLQTTASKRCSLRKLTN